MPADTITPDRLADALAAIAIAREGVSALLREAEEGGCSPAEAAADYAEIVANLKAAL